MTIGTGDQSESGSASKPIRAKSPQRRPTGPRRARMHAHLGCQQRARPGRATVVRPGSRFAACAGAAVAVLLIGAPGAAVSVADPGGSGAHSKGPGGGDQRGGGGHNGRRHTADKRPDSGANDPRTIVGSGRGDTGGPAAREPAPGHRSGSTARPAAPAPRAPRVRFGNGRTPQHAPPASPPPQGDVPVVVPVPAPPPEVVAPPPGRTSVGGHLSPSAVLQLQGARSGLMTDPLFGLAGLVLLPAAGAVLGYRQAKAAQAARALGRPSVAHDSS
jgi:hypothetical protein